MINKVLSRLSHNTFNQRWGLMSKMVLTWPTGEVYLRRWRIIQTPLFGAYVHSIERGDYDAAMHNHPWRATKNSSFYSLIMRGGYTERFAQDDLAGYFDNEHNQHFVAPTFRAFPNNAVHQIIHVLPNTWTLVLVGRRISSWEFYDEHSERLIHWRDFLAMQGRGPTGNRLYEAPDA